MMLLLWGHGVPFLSLLVVPPPIIKEGPGILNELGKCESGFIFLKRRLMILTHIHTQMTSRPVLALEYRGESLG